MLSAARSPFAAFIVFLGLLWAAVVPAVGQGTGDPVLDRLSPIRQQQFMSDARELSDLTVAAVTNSRRYSAGAIDTPTFQAESQRLNPQIEIIRTRWRGFGAESQMNFIANRLAKDRIDEINRRYGYGPQEPTFWDNVQAFLNLALPGMRSDLWNSIPIVFLVLLVIVFVLVNTYALIGHWLGPAKLRPSEAWGARLRRASLQILGLTMLLRLPVLWEWVADVPFAPALWLRFLSFQFLTSPGIVGLFGAALAAFPLWGLLKFIGWVWRGLRYRRPAEDGMPPLSGNYGSARYADFRTELPEGDTGVFFGKSSHPDLKGVPPADQPGAPVFSKPENHTLIVARTRTGKGTRIIVPTLLDYDGSAVVIDPKGENAAITARPRKGYGQEVHVLNPWGELATTFAARDLPPARYNPLDVLNRSDPNAVAVAQALARAVCPSNPGDKDSYWQGSAANVLAAVFLWITDQPDEQKTLARAREIISLSRKDFTDTYLVPMAASSAFHGAIREMVSPYLDLADETYSGIMANLSENTKFLSDPQIKAATATSSFDMADLIRKPTSVYLVIPPDRIDTQRTWLRLIVAAVMHTFRRYPLDQRPGHRCMVLMDEFPALGRMPDMPSDIATMAGYGIDFTLIVQGIDQLKDHYGKGAAALLSNCAYKWFCNVLDLESAKYLSETLGKTTVRTVGQSEGENEGPGGASKSAGKSYGETGRLLLAPDEVLTLGRDVAIVLNPEGHPLYVHPVDYWQLKQAFRHFADQTLRFSSLAFDENPYHAAGQKKAGQGGGQKKQPPPKSSTGPMSRRRALSILGLAEGATEAQIKAAYKRLVKKLHPDAGGTDGLAILLNEARDVLLKGKAA